MSEAMEKIGWKAHWEIHKFRDDNGEVEKMLHNGMDFNEAEERYESLGVEKWESNLALNEGLNELINLICGISGSAWSNANAFLGVGTSNTAAQATDTGLIGTAVYKAMDSTYPQGATQVATWRATFGTSDANQAWEEFTVSNTNSNTGKNLNRKVESKGTKASGETWTLQLQITFS